MKKLTFILILFVSVSLFGQGEIPSSSMILSPFTEQDYVFAPSVSFDGKYLIFSVRKEETYKLYECKKTNGKWSSPKELGDISKFFGDKKFCCAVYNFDATTIYFEAMNGNNTDIFTSSRTETGWTEPKPMSDKINTALDEGEPSISFNDKTLFFTRFEDPKNRECGKIFMIKKDENFEWDVAQALIIPINLDCERTPRILSDNRTLIYSSKRDGSKDFVFYYTKNVVQNIWTTPQAIGVFSKNDNLYAAIDYKGEEIIYSSSKKNKKSQLRTAKFPKQFRPDKMFKISAKILDNKNKPLDGSISLLDPVSIEKQEVYKNNPKTGELNIFIPLKSNYLLDFSTQNHSHYFEKLDNSKSKEDKKDIEAKLYRNVKYGLNVYDRDIYEAFEVKIETFVAGTNKKIDTKTQVLGKGKYLLTLPIGQKYNLVLSSKLSETYKFEVDLTSTVIFERFEKNVEIVSNKVKYSFLVTDATNNAGLECEILLKNKSTSQEIITKAKTNKNGEVTTLMRTGDVYELTVNPHGYTFYNTTLETVGTKNITKKIQLQPLKEDIKIELNNITFETNSAEINLESYKELDNVVKLLLENPEIKVEISAHTDDVGSDAYNQKLSEKRAKSVVEYIIKKDVIKEKLISKGYGETQPLAPNDSDENRAKNRRVELKIIEVN